MNKHVTWSFELAIGSHLDLNFASCFEAKVRQFISEVIMVGIRLSGSGLRAPEEPRGAEVQFSSGTPGRPSHTDPAQR